MTGGTKKWRRPDFGRGLVVDRRPIRFCGPEPGVAAAAHEAPARRHEFGQIAASESPRGPGCPKYTPTTSSTRSGGLKTVMSRSRRNGTSRDRHRVLKWHCRNPFHKNLRHRGCRQGICAERQIPGSEIPGPHGGWDFAVAQRTLVLLPFISWQRGSFNFYCGWREHGNFGIKFNFSTPPGKPTNGVSQPTALLKTGS